MGAKISIHWKTSYSEISRSIDESDLLPIVSVGNDRRLLELREKLISRTGLPVRSLTPEEAEDVAHSPDSHLWVFCRTVEMGSLIYLASAVRRHSPNSKLLLLEGPWPVGSAAILFQRILDPTRSIDLLLTTIIEMAISHDQKENQVAGFILPSSRS